MVRWLRWHCPPDTGFEIRARAVWGRARYLSVTEAPHNTDFHTWMGKKQTAETGNRAPNSGVKGSGANHYPRAPAPQSNIATNVFIGRKMGRFYLTTGVRISSFSDYGLGFENCMLNQASRPRSRWTRCPPMDLNILWIKKKLSPSGGATSRAFDEAETRGIPSDCWPRPLVYQYCTAKPNCSCNQCKARRRELNFSSIQLLASSAAGYWYIRTRSLIKATPCNKNDT